jgi:hypothetical protein
MSPGRVAAAVVGMGSLLRADPVAAQSPWERQIERGLQRVTRALHEDGYRQAAERHGLVLNTGESASLTLTLQEGVASILVGVCDEDCTGLQLALFAENDYEVDGAHAPTAAPMLRLTPRQTGAYRVQVVMTTCRLNPCWAGIALYSR